MKTISFLSDAIERYVKYRKASGRDSYSYVKNIILFDHFCAREYPEQTELSQEIVDRWCKQRSSECTNSCLSRVYPILNFIKYMNKRGMAKLELPQVPRSVPKTYTPHHFTHEELKCFFDACDNTRPRRGRSATIQRMTLPVFFRLLYSSGMRTTEAILLERDDVNLENGVVSIKRGKGYDQHYVVLHDTMLDLMRTYDGRIDELVPHRRVFFPTPDDKPHPPVWVTYHFRVLWQSCNSSHAIPYELRHNYAVENINRWTHQGFSVHGKLLALSKSMGHRQIESTLAYYSLTPAISDIMEYTENQLLKLKTDEKED